MRSSFKGVAGNMCLYKLISWKKENIRVSLTTESFREAQHGIMKMVIVTVCGSLKEVWKAVVLCKLKL